jgi:hypothetical protein
MCPDCLAVLQVLTVVLGNSREAKVEAAEHLEKSQLDLFFGCVQQLFNDDGFIYRVIFNE